METEFTDHMPGIDTDLDLVLRRACEQGLSLATAESCTGGLLASILTDVEGCSHAFDRGFVVYSLESKRDILGVPESLLSQNGAVTRQVALAMAEGALRNSAADIALGITGFAGPGGKEHEEGLVHFACARQGYTPLQREEHFGAIGRGPIRERCLPVALELFGKMLS